MKSSPQRLLVLLTLLAVPVVSNALSSVEPAIASKPEPTLDGYGNKSNDAFYQAARETMESGLGPIGRDYYVVYRTVERIARANGLDERPWRFRVSPEFNVNAFASDGNLLTFESGLLEQIEGDRAALACVVGHEMAHHTENHIPSMVETATRIEALQEEALIEAREEVESANRQSGIFNSVIGAVTGTVGNTVARDSYVGGVLAGPVANQVLSGLSQDQADRATVRAEEIYNERIETLNDEYSEVMHRQESEADSVGYEYMVRAGFSPEGCLRVMDLLTRLETSRLPSLTHPLPADRLTAIRAFNTSATNQRLTQEGQTFLSQSPNALEFNVARDNASIRVESRFGGRDIDEGFPE